MSQTRENVLGPAGLDLLPQRSTIVEATGYPEDVAGRFDAYFSVDVETDGPIPGPFSMLSFALVYAGAFDGRTFYLPPRYDRSFYVELRPISNEFEMSAMAVNGLDRDALQRTGQDPAQAMEDAARWVRGTAKRGCPVAVAYPLGFDWTFLHWYFVRYADSRSPFGYSRAFDIKTAAAVKLGRMIGESGRSSIPFKSSSPHTHHALDDAVEQAEIFAQVFTTSDLPR